MPVVKSVTFTKCYFSIMPEIVYHFVIKYVFV